MTAPVTDDAARGMGAPGTRRMIAGSIVGAIGAYLFQIIVGESIGENAFDPLANQWTLLFVLLTIVFVPVEQWATRESARGRSVLRSDWPLILGISLGTGLLAAVFEMVSLDRLFESDPTYAVQIVALMVAYGFFFAAKGDLAGRRRFAGIGVMLAAESLVRLAVAISLLAITSRAVVLGWSLLAGPVVFLLVPAWLERRSGDDIARTTSPARFLSSYFVGSSASQIMLAGGPLVVGLLGAPTSSIFVTFTLFRAPLTFIYALQSRVLSVFVRWADGDDPVRLRNFGALAGAVGLLLTALAWFVGRWIGPDVVRLLFSDGFAPSSEVAGYVAAGVIAASFAQIIGQVTIAYGRPGRLSTAWVVGFVVATLVLLATGADDPVTNVARAFFFGELVAFTVIGRSVLRMGRVRRRRGGDEVAAADA